MMIAGTERRRQGCSLQDGKQWGINTGGAVRTSTLPIPFTNVFLAVASTSSEWCCPGCSATNTTVTTRAYQSNRPDVAQPNDVNWIIIGCQPQWGYYVESQNPTDYRYWSIPFTSHYITMATKTYYEPKEEAVPWLVGIDMQKFICGYGANFIGSSYVSCVGIGCQLQWGYSNSTGVTFPIAFRECYAVVSNAHSNTTGNTDHYHLLSWTATGAAFGYWNMSFYGTLYIALGVE